LGAVIFHLSTDALFEGRVLLGKNNFRVHSQPCVQPVLLLLLLMVVELAGIQDGLNQPAATQISDTWTEGSIVTHRASE
jgi:hypothetical protein